MKTPQSKLFTTKPRIQSVKPKENKDVEDPDEVLLKQVIEEAKLFRKPKPEKRRDGEK